MNTAAGHIPPDGKLVAVLERDGARWALYYRDAMSTSEYLNFKLIRLGVTAGSANFWLAWRVARAYFTSRDDSARLRAMYPEVAAHFRVFIRQGRMREGLVEVQSADGERWHVKQWIGDAELLPDEAARAACESAQALAG